MVNDVANRDRRMGAFLRARRERLTPAEMGIFPGHRRRRTPGLRREEVAQLAGLSPTWYTWLEQGRHVVASPITLARIATALRMTAAERAYLFELAQKHDPETQAHASPEAPRPLLAALEAIAHPAYLLDSLWNARGWNTGAADLFTHWLGSGERNLLRYTFLDPTARDFICDWPTRARRLIAEFRADTSHYAEDEETATLVHTLRMESPDFAALWEDYAVLDRTGGVRSFIDATRGPLSYEQLTLRPASAPGWKLVLLVPQVATTACTTGHATGSCAENA